MAPEGPDKDGRGVGVELEEEDSRVRGLMRSEESEGSAAPKVKVERPE